MRIRATAVITAAVLLVLIPAAGQAQFDPLAEYSQDFETLVQGDPAALSGDGWLVFGNVFSGVDMTWMYGYGAFPAPNHNLAFCQVTLLEGGDDQGLQQLSVFSDYENADHANGNWIESNVFQEWEVQAADVGAVWTFAFDAKLGNLELQSTALAFIKTLDKANGWALTNFITQDMTATPIDWQGYTVEITIDASLEGQVIQIGFNNTATLYEASVIYDMLG